MMHGTVRAPKIEYFLSFSPVLQASLPLQSIHQLHQRPVIGPTTLLLLQHQMSETNQRPRSIQKTTNLLLTIHRQNATYNTPHSLGPHSPIQNHAETPSRQHKNHITT